MVCIKFWQQTRYLFSRFGKLSSGGFQRLGLLSGIIGPVVLLLADNLSVAVDPDYDPIKMSISDLALGPAGWLSRTGFVVFALLLTLEILILRHYVPDNNNTRIAVGLSLGSAVGFVILAIFTTDPPHIAVHSVHGIIHDITTMIIAILFTAGCFFFGLGFKANSMWRGFYTYTMVVVGIALTCGIIRITMPLHWQYFGLFERIALWNGVIWFEAVGVKLLILSKQRY
jgi:hypothetical membrane protein